MQGMQSSPSSTSSMETLQNSIESILSDSVSQLLECQSYSSNPSLTILNWDQPLEILKPNLDQLAALINDSKARLPASDALLYALKRLVHHHHDQDQDHESLQGEMDVDSCRDLFSRLDVVFATRAAGILESAQSLQPLEEALETLSVPQCSQVWQFIEARIAEVTTDLRPDKPKGLSLLRMSNDLLRRLRRPSKSHSSLAGRILSFLSKVIPLGDKSGINLHGTFHIENETRVEEEGVYDDSQDQELLDERKEVSFSLLKREDGEEIIEPKDPFELNIQDSKDPASDFSGNLEFYLKFWNLQKFFSDPSKLWEEREEKVRVRKEEIVLEEVEEEVEEEIEEEERERMREEKEKEEEIEKVEDQEKNQEEDKASKPEVEKEEGEDEEEEKMDVDVNVNLDGKKTQDGISKSIKSESNPSSGSSTPIGTTNSTSKSRKSFKELNIPTHRKVIKTIQREKTLIKFYYENQPRLGWINFKESTELILKLFEAVGKREQELTGNSNSGSSSGRKRRNEETLRNGEEEFNLAGKDLNSTIEKDGNPDVPSKNKKRKRDESDRNDLMDLDDSNSQGPNAEEEESDFFPKYLTGKRVLEYELRDPSFRRHIVIQYLIFCHYLLRMVPSVRKEWGDKLTNVGLKKNLASLLNLPEGSAGTDSANKENSNKEKGNGLLDDSDERLGTRDQLWVRDTWRTAIKILETLPPNGASIVAAVRVALRRETNWADWKDANCPSIEKSPLSDVSQQMVEKSIQALMAPIPSFPYPLGTNALSELWEGGLASSKPTVTMESKESEEEIDEVTGEPKRIMVEVRRDGLEDLEILPPIPDLRSYVRLVKQVDGRIDLRRKQLGTFKTKEELEVEDKLITPVKEIGKPKAGTSASATPTTSSTNVKKEEKVAEEEKKEAAVDEKKDESSEASKKDKEKEEEEAAAAATKLAKEKLEETVKSKESRKEKENKDETFTNLLQRKQSLSWRALRVSRSEHLNLFTETRMDDIVALQASIEKEDKIKEENAKRKGKKKSEVNLNNSSGSGGADEIDGKKSLEVPILITTSSDGTQELDLNPSPAHNDQEGSSQDVLSPAPAQPTSSQDVEMSLS